MPMPTRTTATKSLPKSPTKTSAKAERCFNAADRVNARRKPPNTSHVVGSSSPNPAPTNGSDQLSEESTGRHRSYAEDPNKTEIETIAPPVSDDSGQFHAVEVLRLNFKTTIDDLRHAFEACGAVHSVTIIHSGTKSLGRGIVQFADADGVNRACEELNKSMLDGWRISVFQIDTWAPHHVTTDDISNIPKDMRKKSSSKKSPCKKSSSKKSPLKKSPLKKSPLKRSPLKKSPLKKSPLKRSPLKRSPVKRSPLKSKESGGRPSNEAHNNYKRDRRDRKRGGIPRCDASRIPSPSRERTRDVVEANRPYPDLRRRCDRRSLSPMTGYENRRRRQQLHYEERCPDRHPAGCHDACYPSHRYDARFSDNRDNEHRYDRHVDHHHPFRREHPRRNRSPAPVGVGVGGASGGPCRVVRTDERARKRTCSPLPLKRRDAHDDLCRHCIADGCSSDSYSHPPKEYRRRGR